ncbi:MAG: PTS sugar transporter subunit IIC [candidate division Zixibacteria bacterium]|nr:PTS sugar transporter subunit IIC [candidate division Zixibacteria bacterium]
MLQELILISIFGGLVALDKTEACQTMFSQPLLIGPVVGFLLNDFSGGLVIGILFQLAYLWVMPIGTATFPDPAVGTVVCSCGFVILNRSFPDSSNLILLLILLFGIPFSLFAGWSLIKQRQLNSRLLQKADLCAEKVRIKRFGYLFFWGLSGSFLRGFVITGSGIICILILLKPLVRLLSFVPEPYLQNLEIPIWGLGIGTMIYLFGRKKNLLWCFWGVCLGIIFLLF